MEFKIRKDEFLRGLYLAHGIADRKSTLPILANVLHSHRGQGQAAVRCDRPERDDDGVAVGEGRERGRSHGRGAAAVRDREGAARRRGSRAAHRPELGRDQGRARSSSRSSACRIATTRSCRRSRRRETFKVDSAVLRDMIAQDHLLRVAGRDAPAPGRRAVRVRRRDRAHGLDRRPPAVEGVAAAAGRAEAGDRRADPAQGRRRAAARDRDARGAERDRHPRRQLRAQGRRRRHLGQADRRAVPALRPGHPEGQRPRVRGVAPGAPGRAQARRADVVGQDVRRAAGRSRRGRFASRATTPTSARPRKRSTSTYKGTPVQIGFNARYFIDLLAEIETPEVRVELSGELDPAVVRPADGSDYVCVVMPMRL